MFSEIFALLSIWYCFMFFSYHSGHGGNNGWSNQFWSSQSSFIIFLFLLNHEEICWLEIGNFITEVLCVQLVLIMHRLRIPAVIYSFFSSCRNALLTIIYTTNWKLCVVWPFRSKARDRVCCYANCVLN